MSAPKRLTANYLNNAMIRPITPIWTGEFPMKMTFVAGLALGVLGCGVALASSQLRIHGSTTVMSNVFEPHQAAIEASIGFTLDVVSNGSGRGLIDLIEGNADMAMISASLADTVAKAESEGVAAGGLALEEHLVFNTEVAFIVHPSNPVQELTLEQVRAILAGEIVNWADVGGASQPIKIVAEDPTGGLRTFVEKELVGGDLGGDRIEVPNGTQIGQVVSQLPIALGVTSAVRVDGTTTRALITDSQLSQPLSFVTVGEPSAQALAVIEAARAAMN
jgi:phosphate transport system substrate-binding protein